MVDYLISFLPGFSVKLTSEYLRAKAGNTGWSYDEILPYFKKSMDQQDRKLAQNTQVYGTKGPLVVETPDFKTKASLGFLKAAEILGLSVKDINDGKWNGVHLDNTLRTKYFLKKTYKEKIISAYFSGNATGFSSVQTTVDEGKRVSSAKAFLKPNVISRKNLDIVLNAHVTKILVKDKTAYGVEFVRLSGYFLCKNDLRNNWLLKEILQIHVINFLFDFPSIKIFLYSLFFYL